MTSIDTNVDNYTISELLSILGLDEVDEDTILSKTNQYIQRFTNEQNTTLTLFFQQMQTKLLQYASQVQSGTDTSEYAPDNTQTEEWYKYEALPQKDQVQKNKITDRFQKIDVYDNQHVPMDREQLGVNNVIDTKVAQDIMNPNLENITTRLINLDSQFRQASGGIDTLSTDYTLDLSDPLTDVISLRLYSIQIPFTWYTIDYPFGNTCFWVTNNNESFKVSVSPGNYTAAEFVIELNSAFQTAGFTSTSTSTSTTWTPVSYNKNSGKITIQLEGSYDPLGNMITGISGIVNSDSFDQSVNPYFTFFDFSGEKMCQSNCNAQNMSFNHTLGWLMGYRLPITPIYTEGNTPAAVLDLYGSKYFILVIDDYNQNHINNGLITITELSNKLSLPSYYNPTLPVECESYTNEAIDLYSGLNIANITQTDLQDKTNVSYTKRQTVLPTAPRTLTQAQIYTINQIIKNREKNTSYRGKAPTASDTFALLPIKHSGMSTGEMYVDFSGALQDNKRIYFGPVDIDRMHIKLLDDRGYTVDLHGSDWCITLISENLYQY